MLQLDLYNNIQRDTRDYIKSPFNYVGGKYKLLNQILPLFPQNIDCMVDVFGGGFNVGINTTANTIIYNDMITPLVELLKCFKVHSQEAVLQYIHTTITDYNLSRDNKKSFNNFRNKYNSSVKSCPLDLYVLLCFSYNYQLRFNNKHQFNSSHGTNRSSFTNSMEHNLICFIRKLHESEIVFMNKDFRQLDYDVLTESSFVYFDPPYYNSTGNYNDGNRGFKNWTMCEEHDLYELLDTLNENNINWGLTNTLIHNGKVNPILKEFIDCNNYNVITINSNYNNSSYNRKNKGKTKELYIFNY